MEYQKEYWEQERKRREPNNSVIKAFVEPKLKFIMKNITLSSNMKILDVGCGNGFFTNYFSKLAYAVGVDYSNYMLFINPCRNLVQATATSLPFKDGSFDVVFCGSLLHHLKNPDATIKEMKRISKKYVIVIEPNRNNPFIFVFSALITEERYALNFSPGYMKNLLNKNGLEIVVSRSMSMIFPNKTPKFLLPILKLFDFNMPIGATNVIVSKK